MRPARDLLKKDLKKIEKRLRDPSILQLAGSAQRRLRERRDTFGYIIGLLERYIDED